MALKCPVSQSALVLSKPASLGCKVQGAILSGLYLCCQFSRMSMVIASAILTPLERHFHRCGSGTG